MIFFQKKNLKEFSEKLEKNGQNEHWTTIPTNTAMDRKRSDVLYVSEAYHYLRHDKTRWKAIMWTPMNNCNINSISHISEIKRPEIKKKSQ